LPFILFPNLSVNLPCHPLPEPVFPFWFTSLSFNMPKCILLSLSSENKKC
jgi:hypothetical protein